MTMQPAVLARDARALPLPRPSIAWRELRLFGVAVAVLLAFAAISAFSLAAAGVGYDGGNDLNQGLLLFSGVLAATMAARTMLGSTLILSAVEGFALVALLSIAGQVASAAVALGHAPLIDPWLAAADRALVPGLDWPTTMKTLIQYPRFLFLLNYIYMSLSWQPVLFCAASLRWGTTEGVARFAGAFGLALLLCVLPFHWLPAMGPYVHFGIAASDMPGVLVQLPWQYPAKLAALRAGVEAVNVHQLSGLITFPSYHAAGAVILARAFWDLGPLRWPMLMLNAAMFVSAVPIGGHYYVDLLAGALVAVAAYLAVDRLHRRLESAGTA